MTSPITASSSHTQSFSLPAPQHHTPDAPSPTTTLTFSGPLRVLQELGADDPSDTEEHDPVTRQIITYGEASVAFKMYAPSEV